MNEQDKVTLIKKILRQFCQWMFFISLFILLPIFIGGLYNHKKIYAQLNLLKYYDLKGNINDLGYLSVKKKSLLEVNGKLKATVIAETYDGTPVEFTDLSIFKIADHSPYFNNRLSALLEQKIKEEYDSLLRINWILIIISCFFILYPFLRIFMLYARDFIFNILERFHS